MHTDENLFYNFIFKKIYKCINFTRIRIFMAYMWKDDLLPLFLPASLLKFPIACKI